MYIHLIYIYIYNIYSNFQVDVAICCRTWQRCYPTSPERESGKYTALQRCVYIYIFTCISTMSTLAETIYHHQCCLHCLCCFCHLFLLCPTLSDLFRPSNFQNVRFAFRCSGSICFCCAIPNDSKVPLYLLRLWISTREFLCSLLCSRNTCEATSRFVSVWTCVNFFLNVLSRRIFKLFVQNLWGLGSALAVASQRW